MHVLGSHKMPSLVEGGLEFHPIDLDVGDVQTVLRKLRAQHDETPVPVMRNETFGIPSCEKSILTLNEVVTQAAL